MAFYFMFPQVHQGMGWTKMPGHVTLLAVSGKGREMWLSHILTFQRERLGAIRFISLLTFPCWDGNHITIKFDSSPMVIL